SGGLAAARLNDKWGYIDQAGNWAIKPQFSLAKRFSEGLASVERINGQGWGYIDRAGHMVIGPKYETAGDFSEGLAVVSGEDEDDWTYIDRAGKAVFRTDKDASWGFSDGLTIVGRYPTRVYIDRKGRVIGPYEKGLEF